MKKILVTGAAGAIGNSVLKYLLSEGKYEITAIDLRTKKSLSILKKYRKRINIIYGDITDPIITDALVRDQDFIIHLAGVMPPLANVNESLMESIDYKGTENIIRAINFYNKKCNLIYASSTSIYSSESKDEKKSVSSKLKSDELDYYSSSKIKIEKLIEDNLSNYSILRLPLTLPDLNKYDFNYTGIRKDTIEVITALDAGYAFTKAIDHFDKIKGNIFNLAGGEGCILTYNDLLINILKYYGLSAKFLLHRIFISKECHGFVYKDSDKLEKILNFRNDSIESYFMRIKRNSKNRTIPKILAKPIIKLLEKRNNK